MPQQKPKKEKPQGAPPDVEEICRKIRSVLDTPSTNGRKVGTARWGVYAFYDYDGEPIYVGQTYESLQERISRHLTNQRSDPVAMNVLDPFEVADIEMWPLWELEEIRSEHPKFKDAKKRLDAAEYTVYKMVETQSSYNAVLNEGTIKATEAIELPPSIRGCIIPDELYELRKHPDVRIARRATTIAALARVISERDLKKIGLRRTLLTQARRLNRLAAQRYNETRGSLPAAEPGEEV